MKEARPAPVDESGKGARAAVEGQRLLVEQVEDTRLHGSSVSTGLANSVTVAIAALVVDENAAAHVAARGAPQALGHEPTADLARGPRELTRLPHSFPCALRP